MSYPEKLLHAEISQYKLHVCTSCREKGTPREPRESRLGFKLYQELSAKLTQKTFKDRVEIKPARCLSLCPRPCGIALSSSRAWTYLFGDQKPGQTTHAIMDCLEFYMSTPDGHMPRERRPKALQRSILGRVPQLEY